MSLFKKKERKKEMGELPELPRLIDLPEEIEFNKNLPQLPDYSSNNINNNFFQNKFNEEQKTRNFLIPKKDKINSSFQEGNQIKEAISGKKEEMFEANEFVREQMMPEHMEINSNKKLNLEFPYKMERPPKDLELRNWSEAKTKKTGQVFIRIDKFEESLKIFEITKSKIVEMEKLLEDIKELKEKEEKELSYWMAEIQTIKNQTEKVERDIFSKLE
ncbi:MAG: hypothetical protein AABY06_03320 [Nanoarchaeota archaeon]